MANALPRAVCAARTLHVRLFSSPALGPLQNHIGAVRPVVQPSALASCRITSSSKQSRAGLHTTQRLRAAAAIGPELLKSPRYYNNWEQRQLSRNGEGWEALLTPEQSQLLEANRKKRQKFMSRMIAKHGDAWETVLAEENAVRNANSAAAKKARKEENMRRHAEEAEAAALRKAEMKAESKAETNKAPRFAKKGAIRGRRAKGSASGEAAE